MKNLKSNLILLSAALLWGFALVAQSQGMNYVGPYTFNCVRFLLGALTLAPVAVLYERRREPHEKTSKKNIHYLLIGGAFCGVALAFATNFQQIAILSTTTGKAGFITSLYIVMVPLLGLFLGHKTHINMWLGVAVAIFGMYFLCLHETFRLSRADWLLLLCALFFALQIMCVDWFLPKVNPIWLSCLQALVCSVISAVFMFVYESPTIDTILSAHLPLLYAGVGSSGIAYTLQILGQKDNHPVMASLVMSLESVVSALAGWLILSHKLSLAEGVGCMLIFVAVLLTQIPIFQRKEKQNN